MLILFNGEILTNVSQLRDVDNSISCLECNGWRYYKSSELVDSEKTKIPCVILPSFSKGHIWESCKIGYIDTNTLEFCASKIILDHMIIRKIEVRMMLDQYYSEIYYRIEIAFYDDDFHGYLTPYHPSVVFHSCDFLYKNSSLNKKKETARTMHYLFNEFPEIINYYLEEGEQESYFFKRPLCLLNFELLKKGWPNDGEFEQGVYSSITASHEYLFDRNDTLKLPYTLEKALGIIQSLKVENKDDYISLEIYDVDFGLNIYIERFFEFAFKQKLLYDKKKRKAYCRLQIDIPFALSTNEDIAAYVACLIHLYLYKYFDLEASRQLYLVSIPQNLDEYEEISTYLKEMEEIKLEEYFYDIYRMLYCCKIEHKQIGYCRVGRDDDESRRKTYEFRPRKGIKISQSVVNKINMLLQTNLKYEAEETGWRSHPERYYYINNYYDSRAAGCAESADLGSAKLQNASFIFVSNYFIKEYLTDKEDFKRFLV